MKNLFSNIKSFLHLLDKTMVMLCLSCTAISVLCCYSFYATGQRSIRVMITQIVAAILGMIIAFTISVFDYEVLARLWKIYVPISVLLVILTYFIGIGATELADDKAWLDLGFVTFQPAELLKLSFIFTFALHLSTVKENINHIKTFLLLCLHGAVPTMLVMLQGDFGTALVFLAIFAFMMFSAGLSLRLISVSVIVAVALAPFVWQYVLPYYLRERFLVAQHPENFLSGSGRGLQQYYGRISIGSGGLLGRGILNQNVYKVPEAHNDYILSYIGQIFGFVGAVISLLLLTAICVKILMTAKRSKDYLGSFICIGVFAMLFFQMLINVGMVLCVTPVIGITLPFLSAGGTSVTVSYAAIGMVLCVYRKNKREMMFD